MNRSWKRISGILLAGLLLLLVACGDKGGSVPGRSYYEQGLEMVPVMVEMASNERYLSTYTNGLSGDTYEMIAIAAEGDRSVPKAVYKITVLSSSYFTMGVDGASDALEGYLGAQVRSSFPNMINGRGGTNAAVAASLCTFQKVFLASGQAEDAIYLYTFEQAVPVAVAFTAGEDNAVQATGSFILYEGEKMDTVEAVQALFEAYGYAVEVEEVQQ